jgi:hypothetical protein
MGYRLHVHKKHVIEYGKDDFNWRHDEINSLLHDTCSCCFNDEDFFENSTEIEVLRKDFKELYSEILVGTDEQIRERLLDTYSMNECTEKGLEEIGFANIATIFKEMDEEAEANSDYIYFSWF